MTGPEDDDAVPTTAHDSDSAPNPTMIDRRRGPVTRRPSTPTLGSRSSHGGTATVIASPLEALARDEIMRTRTFSYYAMTIAVVGLVTVPWLLPGGYYTTRVFLILIVGAMFALAYLLYRTRDPLTFHDGIGTLIGWYIPVLAVNAAVPYFGPFSSVAILHVLGIYIIGLGSSRALAILNYVTCALTQAVTGGLVIFGTVDPGIVRADYLPTRVQVLLQALIQLIFVSTFILARASRRSQLVAIGELESAVRVIAQREALLQEAREELNRALGAGRGRFTEQLIGHYRLGDLIGRGAMGEVYEAVDDRTNQTVAIKMLASTSLGNANHVQRFLRELRTAATIDSPNVVRVLEVGEQPLPHLVMERLTGRDLAAVLRERSLGHDRVIDMIRQVGIGITAAGKVGVIHRDLKPQNIFLADATWKILDFGVSRLADTGDTLTAGHVVGTPSYMAPEQARGADIDHRADLYSLAAIAYRSLTGHSPFPGGEIADVLYRVVHTAPRRPSSLAAVHTDVDLALAIGLAKESEDRFATAAELADALAAALEGRLSDSLRAQGRGLVVDGAWALLPTPAVPQRRRARSRATGEQR